MYGISVQEVLMIAAILAIVVVPIGIAAVLLIWGSLAIRAAMRRRKAQIAKTMPQPPDFDAP